MSRRILLVMMLVGSLKMYAQPMANNSNENNNTEQVVEWNEYYDLSWEDFKGKRPGDAAGDAGTVVQIKAKPFMVKNQVNYDVFALFVKNKSWADAHTRTLLSHEKLHFDIAELYARKIRQRIAELKKKKVNEVDVYNLAIQELLEESNQIDMQYDLETLHGAMEKKQAEWSKRVSSELNNLRKYKKKKRVISAG
jgi:hypothetical protein